MVHEVCCNCSVAFCMTTTLRNERLEDRKLFYCPNGHAQHYTGKSQDQQRIEALELEVRNKELALTSARTSREWAEKRAKGANIAAGMARGALRRTIARVHAGVCPHCNRTFRQLARHMTSKHSEKTR